MKIAAAACAALLSTAAHAADFGSIGSLTQDEFSALTKELGAAFSYKGVTPAMPLGVLGFDGISLADTTGMANPRQVRDLVRKLIARFPAPHETYYTLHFHNTRGMGLANVVAGIEAGVRSFDGSVSGLGGCPFAPGATGNICTEDMVNMLEDMGYDTRVDLAKLLAVARRIPNVVGHEVPGQVMKAGRTLELHDPPEFLRP